MNLLKHAGNMRHASTSFNQTPNRGSMMTTSIKYDVMLNDRFYATLTSTIPYKLYENGGGEIGKEINFNDIEEDVIKRLPTLKNKNFKIALWKQQI